MKIKATQPNFLMKSRSMRTISWNDARPQYPEDRHFQTLLAILLVMFVVASVVFPFLTLPKPVTPVTVTLETPMIQASVLLKKIELVKQPETVPTLQQSLAPIALIPENTNNIEKKTTNSQVVEEKKVLPARKLDIKQPSRLPAPFVEDQALSNTAEQTTAEPNIQPPVVTQQAARAQARQQASNSGLMMMRGQLQQLQKIADESNQHSQIIGTKRSQAASGQSSAVSYDAEKIGQQALSQQKVQLEATKATSSTRALVAHQTQAVVSNSGVDNQNNGYRASTGDSAASAKKIKRVAVRSESSIRQVFEENKSAIFSIYHRALRNNSSLQGKVTFNITIAADGTMTQCELLSSQLADTELEKKLLIKIRQLNFGAQNVEPVTMKYALDFVPS
jgi:periplasmic protein TonB